MKEAERAEEFTRFGVSCSAKKVYGVQGTAVPEHREDVKIMAERGGECDEYREMVEFVKAGMEVKDMEMVGVDLFELGGRSYIMMVDKRSGFRFCAFLARTATSDVQRMLERWFYQYGMPSRLRSMEVLSSGRALPSGVQT